MDYLALLESEVVAMTAALRATPQDRPIAACPGWTVRELTAHVTGVHRWAMAAVQSTEAPPTYNESVVDGDLVESYAEAGAAMLEMLGQVRADQPCWTFNRADRTAGFWQRRQLNELSVHRWDVAAYEVTDEVATDGIDEVFSFFLPRQLATGRATLPAASLQLLSPGKSWLIGEGPATIVEGSPHELLLRLWGRGERLPEPWQQLTP